MSVCFIPSSTPRLYSETGGGGGGGFAIKHRSWVLVVPTIYVRLSKAVLTYTHNLCFEQK